jgi:hydroxymethylglutaryl-CoA synthase
MRDVGIESVSVYLPLYSLALGELAAARGVDPQEYRLGLGLDTMAIAPPCEDAVTLAANAAAPLFERGLVDRDEIGLLLVATESAVDHAKPVSIFVHELLRAQPACRTYELKHACYSGTAAPMTATQWVASGASRRRKALVIASDIARYDVRSAGEPTQGAGAVAMVISDAPRQMTVDVCRSGSFAQGVFDFWRPLDRHEALVEFAGARRGLSRFRARGPWRRSSESATRHGPLRRLPLSRAVPAHGLESSPSPSGSRLAHARRGRGARRGLRAASFENAVSAYLGACRAIGNSYPASLYFCLATLLERHGEQLRDEPVALFSYGSGCCAEFFNGVVGPAAGSGEIGIESLFAARRPITVER